MIVQSIHTVEIISKIINKSIILLIVFSKPGQSLREDLAM